MSNNSFSAKTPENRTHVPFTLGINFSERRNFFSNEIRLLFNNKPKNENVINNKITRPNFKWIVEDVDDHTFIAKAPENRALVSLITNNRKFAERQFRLNRKSVATQQSDRRRQNKKARRKRTAGHNSWRHGERYVTDKSDFLIQFYAR